MDSIYTIKLKFTDLYAEQSRWINMALKFILGLCVFFYIDKNMGYMTLLDKGYISVALAIVCAVAPLTLMTLIAAGVIVAHSYALSYGVAGMVAGIFLMLFIVYFQYTSKQVLALMLTPVAFVLKMPFAIPIVFGLLGNPFTAIPVCCGVLVYYLLEAIKVSADTLAGATGMDMVTILIQFAKEFAMNKEIWYMMVVLSAGVIIVACARRFAIPYAWKIAMVAGIITSVVAAVMVSATLEIEASMGSVFIGGIIGLLIGLVLEIFFFAVDYRQTERLMFDDDEYYYYVTAVPKILMEEEEEEEIEEEVEEEIEENSDRNEQRLRNMQRRDQQKRERHSSMKKREERISQTMIMSTNKVEQELRRRVSKTRNPQVKEEENNTDQQLLEESLKKELDMK